MENTNETMHVKVATPKKILFEGDAKSVSSKNTFGPFDVLPEHANFITFVEREKIVIGKADGGSQEFQFPFAIIYNNKNILKIYTEVDVEGEDRLVN